MTYVVSTLSADTTYVGYNVPEVSGKQMARPAVPVKSVTINGGAGVANRLVTPQGVITSITDADADFLKDNKLFRIHEANGYVKLFRSEVNADKAAEDMTNRDLGSQLDEAKGDFEEGGKAQGIKPKNKIKV